MNRTEMYEQHTERIAELRKQTVEARSAARAFADYANLLRQSPTMGAVADGCRDMLIDYADKCAADCYKLIDANTVLADRMEREGMPDAPGS